MEKELMWKPKKIEVFEKAHTKKGAEPSEVVWCNDRSKKTTIQYSVLETGFMDQLFAKA